jgi:autotransporter-associated beta strand protein
MKATASTHTRAKKNTIAFQNFLRNAAAISLFANFAAHQVETAKAAAYSLTSGTTYTQTFDSISTSAALALPTGWLSSMTSAAASVNNYATAQTTLTGAYGTVANSYGTYVFADTSTSADKALGFQGTSNLNSSYGNIYFAFTNNTGSVINKIDLTWNYEKFRAGTSAANGAGAFIFSSSNSPTSTYSTTYGQAAGNSSFTSDASTSAFYFNATEIKQAKSVSLVGLNLAAGATYYLDWSYKGNVSNLAELALDDFTLTATLENNGYFYNGGATSTWTSSSTNWSTSSALGGALAQSSAAVLTFGGTAGTVTVSGGVTAAAGITFTTTGYNITGSTINLSGSTSDVNTIMIDGASSTATIASALTGTSGLNKAGTGLLMLSGNNTYSGTTAISAGTLKAGSSTAFGTSTISVTSGAVLDLNGFSSIANALSISGSGISSGGALINSASNLASYDGLVQLSADATIKASGGDITLTNTGNMNSSSTTRTLTVGGQYNTTINEATANIAIVKNDTGTLTLNGINTATYSTTAGNYALVVNGGTVKFGSTQPIGSAGSNAFGSTQAYTGNVASIKSGGTIDLNGQQVGKTALLELAGTGAASAGGALINSSTSDAKMQGLYMLMDNTTISANSTGGLLLTSSSNNARTLNTRGYTLTLGGTGTSTNNQVTTEIIGTGSIVKSGTGTWTLAPNTASGGTYFDYNGSSYSTAASTSTSSDTNSFTGSVSVSAGTLKIGGAGALGSASGVTVSSGATLDINGQVIATTNALTISGTGAAGAGGALINNTTSTSTNPAQYSGLITLGANATISANGASTSPARSILLSNTGTITGSGFTLTVDGVNDTTISSIIGTGTGGVNKTGAGTLLLSGANTYTGATNVSAGRLRLGNVSALGYNASSTTASAVTVSSGATLDLNGKTVTNANSLTISGTGAGTYGGALINSSASTSSYGGLLTLGGNATIASTGAAISLTNTGNITGSGYPMECDKADYLM